MLALLLTGCGGSEDPPQARQEDGPVMPKDVAEKRLLCNLYEDTEASELGVERQGQCQINADYVVVKTFSNNQARDTWVDVARAFGGPFLVGDRYVATSDSPDVVEMLSDRTSDEIVR